MHLPGARVEPRPVAPPRRFIELPAIEGAGRTAKELDDEIAKVVAAAKPSIDDQVARLLIWNVPRGTARDLDHAALRAYKARALNFQLDVRRPEEHRVVGIGAPGQRQTLPETVREFLGRRPLDADLDRPTFVRLGVEYVDASATGEEPA